MRLLSLDYGIKRIGMALGELENKVVVPYGIIENKGRLFVLEELKKICHDEVIDKIIVGVPYHKDMESKQAKLTEEFVEFLRNKMDAKVEVFDEMFTSKIADNDLRYKDLMKEKKKGWRDAIAAAEILRLYLEFRN